MTKTSVLFLCTGNASRSVMAGSALAQRRPDLNVATAGTLVIDGLPLSVRTRSALQAAGLSSNGHRSRQVDADQLRLARIVVAMAPEHVFWVRRNHPEFAARTVTLRHLAQELSGGEQSAHEWITSADLRSHQVADDEEIVDPGGGEVDGYIDVAHQIVNLINQVAARF